MQEKFFGPVLGALAALVIGILTTALSDLGPMVRELVSPTSALVEGFVMRNQAPTVAEVMLDGRAETRDETDGYGQFLFSGVAEGDHCYSIVEQPGRTVWIDHFDVARGATEKVVIANYDLAIALPSSGATADCIAAAEARRPIEATTTPASPSAGSDSGDEPVPATTPFGTDIRRASATLEAMEVFLIEANPGNPEEVTLASLADAEWALATVEAGTLLASDFLDVAVTAAGTPEAAMADERIALEQSGGTPPPDHLRAGLPPEARLVTVQIAAPPSVLGSIASVTYVLDPSLSPSVVTRESAADGFAFSLIVSEPTTLSADVSFTDGRLETLMAEVGP